MSLIVTCRTQTWHGDLASRLSLQPHLIEVGPFDDDEFATAMTGLEEKDSERLWNLGAFVRKPRYLADAIEHVRAFGSADDLTIERLYYDAWQARAKSRTDYPLGTMDFEALLRHFAENMRRRLAARDIIDGLPSATMSDDILRELASGGVLQRLPSGGYAVEEPYLVEGLSLLLVDMLEAAAGTIAEYSERISQWLGDTHRYPMTAKICAAAATKALLVLCPSHCRAC